MTVATCERNCITISIIEINRNKVYNCEAKTIPCGHCSIKKELCLSDISKNLCTTTVLVDVANASYDNISIDVREWGLVDTMGYAYTAQAPCLEFRPPRMSACTTWKIAPGTRIRNLLFFPELRSGIDVHAILCGGFSMPVRLNINDLTEDAQKVLGSNRSNEDGFEYRIRKDFALQAIRDSIDNLRISFFQRFNNVLTNKEAVSMDNSIRTSIMSIKTKLNRLDREMRDYLTGDFYDIEQEYESKAEVVKEQERKYNGALLFADKLNSLSPREFEVWSADLLTKLGYDKVTLTPPSGDKGIDILVEKNGEPIAVQCKRFKGTIGAPIIQAFLGAMQNAGISRGIFITTSTYSMYAEQAAQDVALELYDKHMIHQLIQSIEDDNLTSA